VTTTGEKLVALSSLSSGTAMEHLLAISGGGGATRLIMEEIQGEAYALDVETSVIIVLSVLPSVAVANSIVRGAFNTITVADINSLAVVSVININLTPIDIVVSSVDSTAYVCDTVITNYNLVNIISIIASLAVALDADIPLTPAIIDASAVALDVTWYTDVYTCEAADSLAVALSPTLSAISPARNISVGVLLNRANALVLSNGVTVTVLDDRGRNYGGLV
jgi:hypothetical protein